MGKMDHHWSYRQFLRITAVYRMLELQQIEHAHNFNSGQIFYDLSTILADLSAICHQLATSLVSPSPSGLSRLYGWEQLRLQKRRYRPAHLLRRFYFR